jgi:hypothetical protein
MGFVVDDNGPLQVKGNIKLEKTDLNRDGLVFVRYEVEFDVINANGKTVVAVAERGREGHVSEAEAEARCVRSIAELINVRLHTKLQSWFDGLIKR